MAGIPYVGEVAAVGKRVAVARVASEFDCFHFSQLADPKGLAITVDLWPSNSLAPVLQGLGNRPLADFAKRQESN